MSFWTIDKRLLTTPLLRQALRRHRVTSPYFDDVYALDQLPRSLPKGKVCLVNTQPSDLPGEHWFVVYRDPEGMVYHLDSYGLEPPDELRDYTLYYYPRRLQGIQPHCGYYALIFALAIQRPYLLDLFSSRCSSSNDRLAKLLAQKEFGV